MISESFLIRPRGNLLRNLVLFVRLLRSAGLPVSPDQVVDLTRALPLLNIRAREEFRDAARAMLVTSRDQVEVFDRAFDMFWQAWSTDDQQVAEDGTVQKAPPSEPQQDGSETSEADEDDERKDDPEPAQQEDSEPEPLMSYSAIEVLRQKDFGALTDDERTVVSGLMRGMLWQPEPRRTRRRRVATHGAHLDPRRMMRGSLRFGGESIELAWQQPKLKRRPLVVLCDVSGSMESYARVLLQFLYALTNGLDDVRAFAFGTRLTHLTRQLRQSKVDQALRESARAVNDWGGGTRIGSALKTFNYDWARRVLGHGATVLIISDGWDRGDLGLLQREVRRLQLSCRRLIWLNPLLGAPGYQPLAQGIKTVLPYVDDFLPFHNLVSLERLALVLASTSHSRDRRHRKIG